MVPGGRRSVDARPAGGAERAPGGIWERSRLWVTGVADRKPAEVSARTCKGLRGVRRHGCDTLWSHRTGGSRMNRRFELGPILVALGALLLIVSLFLDWYGALSAWEAFEVVDVLLAALAVTSLVGAIGSLLPELGYV